MLQRMDNVLIVVEDLEAAKAFFAELDAASLELGAADREATVLSCGCGSLALP